MTNQSILLGSNTTSLDAEGLGSDSTQRRSLLSIIAWSLIAAMIPIMRMESVGGIGPLTEQRMKLVVFMALALSVLFGRFARPVGLPVWLAGVVLIPFAGFVSGHASSISGSLVVAAQLAVLCALAPAVFRFHVLHTRDFLPWVLGAFLLSQTVSASVGLAQLSGAQVLGQEIPFGRSTGLAGHPNVLGLMSAIALLMTVGMLRDSSRLARVVLLGVFAINALALVASGSLSAILAGAIGAVVFAIGIRRLTVTLLLGAIIWTTGMLLGIANAWLVSAVIDRVAVVTGESQVGGAASIDARVLTYQWALDYISGDPIFGVGMDDLNKFTYNGVSEVHNYLLHSWYQGGLTLLIWFIAVTGVLLAGIVRALKYRQSVGAAAVTAALIAFAATSTFFVQQQYWLPLLLAVAILPGRINPGEVPTFKDGRLVERDDWLPSHSR